MKPMVRSNICLNSHPQGCKQEVLNQIAYTKSVKEKTDKLAGKHRNIKNVLVLGCSTGYGLASRITAAFAYGADTIGVSFEKEGTEKKFGTPGWYNNMAFDAEAKKAAQTFRSVYMKEKSELNTLKVKRKIINCLEEKGYAALDCDNQIDMVNREKVEEFNSRRICHENCEDASPGEIEKHINSIKDDKENMKIDTDEYKSVEYENYEDDIEE